MRKLPCAGGSQDDDLNDHPANDTRVGRLGLVSELGLSFLSSDAASVSCFGLGPTAPVRLGEGATHSLENLFSADILQPGVQILDALGQVLHLALVGALDLRGLTNSQVQLQLDAAVGVVGAKPALAAAVGGRGEADLVLAGLGGAEGEAARGLATV